MTDATTGAGAEDRTKRRSVTPIPPETTGTTQTPEAAEREPVRGAGDLAGGGAAGLREDRTTGRVMGQEKGQETDREGVASDLHSTSDKGRPSTSGTAHRTGTTSTTPAATTTRLLPHEECDKLELRLRQAVSGFVDGPRDAVEEADHVVEEIAGRFTEALTRRRRTLRMSWQDGERGEKSGSPATHPDTEQLRLALRDYRELAERLLQS
ncbi:MULTISPECIES: hypothetical protein [unclassified Streptomyces]|uniref:hypothetical protein n=1 Tax=unclassified Streptomyces TaxID=2593676 RepID=UPI002259E4D7|nr:MULTISPECIES: hypothetical protein [unclassified Streptomyces]MCX5057452.1 hypothetical protein [Streptomyces sp. NBC_00452]MCX5288526.1 hypothetical protein [Streptomyces sp. NBC_00183]